MSERSSGSRRWLPVAVAVVAGAALAAAVASAAPTRTAAPSAQTPPAELAKMISGNNWSYPAEFIDCKKASAKGCNSTHKVAGVYKPLPTSQITKKWNICVSFPHLKDPYWLAVNYGAVLESKRDKVKMKLVEAGGYTNLSTQINQLDNCAASGANAVVIGGISYAGLDAEIAKLRQQGIVVIDVINGLQSPKVDAHAMVNFYDMGHAAGEYLAKLAKSKTVNAGFFPGPPGAGWVETSDKGFMDAIKGSKVKLLTKKYGDTGKDVQLNLVQDALQAFPDMQYVVGTAVTANAAVEAVAARHLTGKVKIVGDYLIPDEFQQIKQGKIACAPTDQPVVQARMAIDEAVRLLEHKPLSNGMARVGPKVELVCGPAAGSFNNLKSFVSPATFAPASFKPVFNVG